MAVLIKDPLLDQKWSPKYKDLVFKNEADYVKWLKELTAYTVRFYDEGQDFILMWLDKGGEILGVEWRSLNRAFCGRIVALKYLKIDQSAALLNNDEQKYEFLRWMIKEIEEGYSGS